MHLKSQVYCSTIFMLIIPINNHQHLHISLISCFLRFLKAVLICKDMEVCLNWEKIYEASVLCRDMKLMVFLLVYIQGKCLKTAENQKGLHWFSLCLEFRGRQTCNTEAWAPQGGLGRRAVALSEACMFRSPYTCQRLCSVPTFLLCWTL